MPRVALANMMELNDPLMSVKSRSEKHLQVQVDSNHCRPLWYETQQHNRLLSICLASKTPMLELLLCHQLST